MLIKKVTTEQCQHLSLGEQEIFLNLKKIEDFSMEL